MSPRDWRDSLRLTQEGAAMIIGVGRRQWQRYEAGSHPVPVPVARSMRHLAEHPEEAKIVKVRLK